MNEVKNLTNVIRKLGKLVHKQNCSHDFFFFFFFINYNIIIVQVRYINIETKEVVRIKYNELDIKKPVISNSGRFFCFNSTVSCVYLS